MAATFAFVGSLSAAPAASSTGSLRTWRATHVTSASPSPSLARTPRRPRCRFATTASAAPRNPRDQNANRPPATPAPGAALASLSGGLHAAAALATTLLLPLHAALAQDGGADAAAAAAAAAAAEAADALDDLPESMRDTSTLSRVLVLIAFGLLIYATVGSILLGVNRVLTRNSEEKEKQLVQDWLDGKPVKMGMWGPKKGDSYDFPPDFPYKPKSGPSKGNRESRRILEKNEAKERKKKAAEKRQAKGLAKEQRKQKKSRD